MNDSQTNIPAPPAPTSEPKAPTSASGWKKKKGLVIELPSGNHARIRTPGLPAFLKMGFVPDSLVGIVRSALGESETTEEDVVAEMLEDQERLSSVFDLYDKVAVFCFMEPELAPVPVPQNAEERAAVQADPDALRDPEVLYVDEVEFDDKQYVFTVAVGGEADLSSFRQQQADAMGGVQHGEAVGSQAE